MSVGFPLPSDPFPPEPARSDVESLEMAFGSPSPPEPSLPVPVELPPQPDPVPPVPVPPVPSATPVLDSLRQRGYDTARFASDSDAVSALVATAQEYHNAQPMIQTGQRLAPYADRIDGWLRQESQSAAPPVTPAPQPVGLAWDFPEYNPEWERNLRLDPETGRFAAPGTMPELAPYAQKVNEYHDAVRQKGQRIVNEFPGLVQEVVRSSLPDIRKELGLGDSLEEAVATHVARELSRNRAEQEAQQWRTQRREVFFELDPVGNHRLDQTGQPMLTPRGQAMLAHLTQAEQQFGWDHRDPIGAQRIRQYADAMLAADEATGKFGPPSPASPSDPASPPAGTPLSPATVPAASGPAFPHQPAPLSPAQVGEVKRGEFLEKVAQAQYQASRDGTIPPDTLPERVEQNPDATLDQIFDDEARKAGIAVPSD